VFYGVRTKKKEKKKETRKRDAVECLQGRAQPVQKRGEKNKRSHNLIAIKGLTDV
jgi:hypothetical protein